MRPRKKIRKPLIIEKPLKRGTGYYLRYWLNSEVFEPLITDKDGKPATAENVDILVGDAIERIAKGKHPFRTLVPFADFIDEYIDSLGAENDPTTKEGKRQCLEYFARRMKDERHLRYVGEVVTIEMDWYEGERKPNLSKSTWRRELSYIRHALRYAVREGMLDTDPTLNCSAPKPKYTSTWLKEPITPKEHALMAKTLPFPSACAWRFCMETGARPGEMAAVTIDLFHSEFKHAGYVMNKTKKFRPVTLSDELAEDLAKLAKGRPRSEHMFLTPTGIPWSQNRNSWLKHVYWYAAKAGIERKLNPNLERHTAATTLAEAGYGNRELMEFFGWENAETPMKYTHATKQRLAAMADQLHARAATKKTTRKGRKKSGGQNR